MRTQEQLFERYQLLQNYVGWTELDGERIRAAAETLSTLFPALIEDFYQEIDRHEETRRIITGGVDQQERLKQSLLTWLHQLVSGVYDATYVEQRWQVGRKHVQIGLDQGLTSAALSRLRRQLSDEIERLFSPVEARPLLHSLSLLIDLDLAIIQAAYQIEYSELQTSIERARRLAETQRVQEALAVSEQALRAVLQAAPCAILILTGDGIVRYFSPFAEQLTGYAADDILGQNGLHILLEDEAVRTAAAVEIQRTLAGSPVEGFTIPLRDRTGATHWMMWNSRPIADYQGGPAVLAVGQDITQLRDAQQRVVQTERLAAIGEMIAGLTHESRNALQRSQACLEMLTLEIQDRPAALDLVNRIQNAQDTLHQLYEEVRDYAAPVRLQLEHRNVRRILEDTWEHLAVQRRGKLASLLFISYPGIPRCRADALALEQVFRNILENSLNCGANPVEIEIRMSDSWLEGRPALCISLLDNGPGLSPESRRRIFEPFFTTKTKGTGLGMAIVKRLVEAHGGKISLGDNPTGGAEIIVTLPTDGPLPESL